MLGSVALRGGRPVDHVADAEAPVAERRFDGESSLEWPQRLAVAGVLFVTGLMFTTPPAVALLFLVGALR